MHTNVSLYALTERDDSGPGVSQAHFILCVFGLAVNA